MPLHIDRERVSVLAAELARETGESIDDAVEQAIAKRLDEVRIVNERRGLADRLRLIAERCVRHAPPEWLTKDFDSELYDEKGLPK